MEKVIDRDAGPRNPYSSLFALIHRDRDPVMILCLIILSCLAGNVLSVGLAGTVLLLGRDYLNRFTTNAVSYALGTLLGAAFLGMIPNALSRMSADRVLIAVIAGIILFFLLEKMTVWRHCHEEGCEVHSQEGTLILIGDSMHNFVDGVAIAAAFIVSVPLGIATSLAVITHEVPQEVGDFAILIQSGFSRMRAFVYNMISGLSAVAGGILTYFLIDPLRNLVPYLLSVSAASFIYIALADLVPVRRSRSVSLNPFTELALILLGVGTILSIRSVLHG